MKSRNFDSAMPTVYLNNHNIASTSQYLSQLIVKYHVLRMGGLVSFKTHVAQTRCGLNHLCPLPRLCESKRRKANEYDSSQIANTTHHITQIMQCNSCLFCLAHAVKRHSYMPAYHPAMHLGPRCRNRFCHLMQRKMHIFGEFLKG